MSFSVSRKRFTYGLHEPLIVSEIGMLKDNNLEIALARHTHGCVI